MTDVSIDEVKKKLLDDVEAPYELLEKAFAAFDEKWKESQKLGPLDRKEMDTLILEALDEGLKKINKKKLK